MKSLDFRKLKDMLAIVRVAEWLGLTLKKKGTSQFKADCPVKGTKNALIITPEYEHTDGSKGAFFCFSCEKPEHRNGDAIQLTAKVHNTDALHAAEELAQAFGKPKVTKGSKLPPDGLAYLKFE